ncbi:hypothetical protein K443DRAFT_674390 [Laccaria amethystina LaAM-08-1]|uniref:C2H2-type domain-containing protein n=1 Tax=Laccaria amethystina LaAM-08-1 TaxID=1095629 RepID=A0A0C9YE25_9AGAR|nr:hypothetical protein K443DRAFT_674390 [Laccaria amethystina LaAM-08-1]
MISERCWGSFKQDAQKSTRTNLVDLGLTYYPLWTNFDNLLSSNGFHSNTQTSEICSASLQSHGLEERVHQWVLKDMLTQLPHSEAIDVKDAPHSKALDSNTFTPLLLLGQLADPRMQLLPEDLLEFSPSLHPDDLLTRQYDGNIVDAFLEYPFDNHRCLDPIQDVFGFNGESPESGSWSLESTPSLMVSGLSPFSNVDDLSPPCTPNTGIPLPDFCDWPNDINEAAPSSTRPLPSSSPLLSTVLLPSLVMSPPCSQVSLNPASTTSLLFSLNDPEAAAYAPNDIEDGYEAPQPVSLDFHFPPHGPHSSPSCGQGSFSHSSPCSYSLPTEILLSPASESGRSGTRTDMVDHPSDELEESGYRFPYILRQSLDKAKWIDGCLPSTTYVATMGQSEVPLKRRRPVNAVEAPMSSMSRIDDATISTGDKKRRKTDTINFRSRACAAVSSTSYIRDAETSMMGDMQRHQADSATDSPIRGLPCLPLNTSMGGLGRQPSRKAMQTAGERASYKKTSRVRKEAGPSKVPRTPTRGGISDQSGRTTSSPPGTPSSLGSSASSSSGGMVFKIGSVNVSAASQLRRKHKEVFQCNFPECRSTFTKRHNLKIHIERHMGVIYLCPGCKHPYAQEASMHRHKKNCKQVH